MHSDEYLEELLNGAKEALERARSRRKKVGIVTDSGVKNVVDKYSVPSRRRDAGSVLAFRPAKRQCGNSTDTDSA